MKNIIFRTDADDGNHAGTGHLTRIIKIMNFYKSEKNDYNFIFLFKNLKNSKKIFSSFENNIVYNKKFHTKLSNIKSNDLLIVDTPFGIDQMLKKFCIEKKIKKILLIDDLNKPNLKNVYIFNGIISLKKKLKKNNKVFQGLKYVILDKKYSKHESVYQKRRNNKKNILISTGGTDKKNLLYKYSKHILRNHKINVYAIIGSQVSSRNKIFQLNDKKLFLIKSPSSLYKYFLKSDICIITGGITMFEALALKKTILVHQAYHHQKYAIDFFQRKNNLERVGIKNNINIKKLSHQINLLINSKDSYTTPIDGRGFFRLQKILKKLS